MSKPNVFMSFAESTADATSVGTPASPVTTVEVDERTGVQTETTTLNTNVDLPSDDNDVEVSKLILDDCLKCIDRNETSLENLLRIYKKHTEATTVLSLSLEKANKKEKRQQEKAESLQNALKIIADNLPKIAENVDVAKSALPTQKPGEQQILSLPVDVEQLQRMINLVREKIAELRQACKEIDKENAELKARMEAAKKKRGNENFDEELSQLARHIDELKSKHMNLLRVLKQTMLRIGSRLKKNYDITEDPSSSGDVKFILDNLLTDVKHLLRERDTLQKDRNKLREENDALVRQIKAAEDAHRLLIEEAKKLLKIGDKDKAGEIDPTIFGDVSKFVENIFDDLVISMEDQNKRMGQYRNAVNDTERGHQQRRREFQREKATKLEQMQRLRDEIDAVKRKNEALRDDLARPSKSPVASRSDPAVEERMRRTIDERKANDQQRENAAEQRLAKARERNNAAQQNLKDLTARITDVDDALEKKRTDLKDLRDALKQDQDGGERRVKELENQATKKQAEIDALERQLDDLLDKMNRMGDVNSALSETNVYESRLLEKIRILDGKLARAGGDRDKLIDRLINADDDCNRLRDKLADEDAKRQCLEKDLDNIQEDIDKATKALDRKRQQNLEVERSKLMANAMQQFLFQQTTRTTITAGPGGSSVASMNPCIPVQNASGTVTGSAVVSIISESSDTRSLADENQPH